MRWAQAIPLGALAVFFAFPVVTMLASFARPSDITSTLTNASLVRLWWFTAWQAALSTVLTVAVALPITWAVSRYSFRFSKTLIGLITVPFFMPAVVIATGVKAVLPSAPVPAILWAHVVFNVAVIVRIVGPRWAMLDTTLEDTAADLGATSLRTFRFIVLPHIAPALKNAAAVVFLFCFSSFGVIAILGGIKRRTIEAEIFTQAVNLGDTRTAVSLSVIQAVVILIVFTLGTRQSRVTNTSRTTDTTNDIATTLRIPTQRQRRRIVAAVALPVLIVVAPLVAVILRSLRLDGHFTLDGYRWLFNGTTEAVGINIASTLLTSTTFAITCAVLTTTAALMIASAKNNTSLISALTAFPLMVSAVTLGLGLIVTFDQAPFEWRVERWLIPVIHCVIALPLAVRTLDPAVHAIPESLTQASASLGAGPWKTWRRIELPLLTPALVRSAGLSAAISLGEFGATSFLTRSNSTTVPIAISQLLGHPGAQLSQAAFALAALCVLLFTAALRLA
jgi:thiamine transport system permease protein